MKELHGQALGVWTIGGAELGGNRNTDQSREPQRVRGGQRGTHRRQKTGPCDSGQPLGPPDSAASSGTWALVGRLRQGGSSQAPPGPARTPTTPPPQLLVAQVPLESSYSYLPPRSPLLTPLQPPPGFSGNTACVPTLGPWLVLFQLSGIYPSLLPPHGAPFAGVTGPLHTPLRFLHSSCHGLTLDYLFFQWFPPQKCWAPLRSAVGPAPPGRWSSSVCGGKGEPGRGMAVSGSSPPDPEL